MSHKNCIPSKQPNDDSLEHNATIDSNQMVINRCLSMLDMTQNGSYFIDITHLQKGNITQAEPQCFYTSKFKQLLGFSEKDIFPNKQTSFFSKLNPEHKKALLNFFDKQLDDLSNKYTVKHNIQLKTKENGYHWFSLKSQIQTNNQFHLRIANITIESLEEKLLNYFPARSKTPIFLLTPSFAIKKPTLSLSVFSGYTAEELESLSMKNLFDDQNVFQKIKNHLKENKFWQGNIILKNKEGLKGTFFFYCYNVYDINRKTIYHVGSIDHFLGQGNAFQHKKMEAKTYQSFSIALTQLPPTKLRYNELTQLPTYSTFKKAISDKKNHCANTNTGEYSTYITLDIDNFSRFNQYYGRATGDRVLVAVAKRLAQHYPLERLCHYSADEFFIFLSCPFSKEKIVAKINKLHQLFNHPFLIENEQHHISVSLGVFITQNCDISVREAMYRSGLALGNDKRVIKGQIYYYTDETKEQRLHKQHIALLLPQIIEKQDIHVYYQPQIDAKTNQIVSVEALSRWKNNTINTVPPEEFIRIAEEYSYISELDAYVFKRACLDLKECITKDGTPLKFSVNISPIQFLQDSFIEDYANICKKNEIDPSRITLEITENVTLHQTDELIIKLQNIRSHGFGLSMDDFGTGYSSLSYINLLPLTEVKIDKNFIINLFTEHQNQTLFMAMVAICQVNGFKIVAEGVETKKQADWLRKQQCDLLQGFFYNPAISIDEIKKQYC